VRHLRLPRHGGHRRRARHPRRSERRAAQLAEKEAELRTVTAEAERRAAQLAEKEQAIVDLAAAAGERLHILESNARALAAHAERLDRLEAIADERLQLLAERESELATYRNRRWWQWVFCGPVRQILALTGSGRSLADAHARRG
jgi:hypothetical protein